MILILIVQVILILVVQGILVILLFLVLVVLAIGLCRLRSEDNENTDETEDVGFGNSWEEDTHFTDCDAMHWYRQWCEQQDGIGDEISEADVSAFRGNGPLPFEENEDSLETILPWLSAGGGFVLEEGNFPPLEQRHSSGTPLTSQINRLSPQKDSLKKNCHGRTQLNMAAKFKHIDPTCRSEEDAEKKSLERNSRYPQEIGEYNTVFQVNPDNFTLGVDTRNRRVLKSKEAVRNWKCQKVSDSKYEGTEESRMHAVFLAPEEDCHYSPEESRKTQVSGGA